MVSEQLVAIYKKYSKQKNPDEQSQMCLMWSIKNPPDVLETTKPIIEFEEVFDIELPEDKAIELYDMNLLEAQKFIDNLQ
jgi:hypothetical protein